uniref:Glycosyltransferase n=1 Tax=Ignisphaera aggregans TaxID=334771 RepID=A0A7J2U0W5_9CREN
MTTKIFVGTPSYNRGKIFRYCIRSFTKSKLIKGFILVIDASSDTEKEFYVQALKELIDRGFEVMYDINVGRRGSVKARNLVLDIAEKSLGSRDILLLYDDDYIYAGDESIIPALYWLKNGDVGIVGGRVINLRKRRIDPDFALNIPYLADVLTRLTGFIFLNTKHGPRYVEYTTPLMALRVEVLSKGIRYDENYGGTGYREESDLQEQVKSLGYEIVFEPRFYAYHLAIESGGNRYSDLEDRMYWKWRNHTYFMNKWHYPLHKKILSYMILTLYALLNGTPAIRGIAKAVRVRQ